MTCNVRIPGEVGQGCGVNAWAKPSVALVCGACDVPLQADEDAGED